MFHHSKKTTTVDFQKKSIHIEKLWMVIVTLFFVGLLLSLGFFFWYFMKTGTVLETPPTLGEDTTQQKLQVIEKRVSGVEKAVAERTGGR